MPGDAVTPERSEETKVRAFVSYARADLAFADRLAEGLKARGFETLIRKSSCLDSGYKTAAGSPSHSDHHRCGVAR